MKRILKNKKRNSIDLAHEMTDKEILRLENRINKVYSEAQKDIQNQMGVFLSKFKAKEKIWLKKIENGEATKEEYQKWLQGQVFQGKQWQARKSSIANTLYYANETAINMVNDKVPDVFQLNANFSAYDIEVKTGCDVGFQLYDSATVRKLMLEDADILPYKKINKAKDKVWNFQSIRNEVTKSIISGESSRKLSKRLAKEMPNRNSYLLKTHARTMLTSAQNQGRMTRYEEAKGKGIVLKKVWLATSDGRTRYEHAMLNGQVRDLDKPFEIEGYEIMQPADAHAHPSMTYNCRCTMTTEIENIKAIRDKYPSLYRDNEKDEVYAKHKGQTISYGAWQKRKTAQKKVFTIEEVQSKGKDILEKAYEEHRIIDNTKSVPISELKGASVISAEYRNIQVESAKLINSTLSKLTSDYNTPLQRIRTMSKQEAVGMKDIYASTIHNYSTDSAEIILNPVKVGDKAKMVDRIKELRQNKWCVNIQEGREQEYIITHEFAHTLFNFNEPLNNKTNWVGANYDKIRKARKEIQPIYDEYSTKINEIISEKKRLEMKYLLDFDEKAGEDARKLAQKLDEFQISRYSLSNIDEFMAESFANERIGSKSNIYANKVMSVIDKYFKKV